MPGKWCQCDSCHTELARSLGKMYHFVSLFLTLSVRIALWPYCWISVSRNTSNRSSLAKQGRSRKRERKEWVQEEKKTTVLSIKNACIYITVVEKKFTTSFRTVSSLDSFCSYKRVVGRWAYPQWRNKREREERRRKGVGGWKVDLDTDHYINIVICFYESAE